MDLFDLVILLFDYLAEVHGLFFEPAERFLQGADASIQLHLELLLTNRLLDE